MSFSRAYRRPSRPVAPDVQELRDRHMLAPESDPGLHIVGDYLFDCTINGVFDSAEYVSEAILSEWRQRVYNETVEEATSALGRYKANIRYPRHPPSCGRSVAA